MNSKCCLAPTKVVDSRDLQDGLVIRRRRECTRCLARETSYEKYSDDRREFMKLETAALREVKTFLEEKLNRIERLMDDEDEQSGL